MILVSDRVRAANGLSTRSKKHKNKQAFEEMSEKNPAGRRRLSDAIRAQRPSGEETDLTRLNKTLVKSGLWKKLTLERIEASRNGVADDADREILNELKVAMGDIVEQYWQDLVRSAAAKVDHTPEAGTADPANDDDIKREVTNARKLLALHEATMRKARYRLYEQWAHVYVRSKRIDCLVAGIAELKTTHAQELEQQRANYSNLQLAFEEFQQQADLLLDELDTENLRLKASAGLSNA